MTYLDYLPSFFSGLGVTAAVSALAFVGALALGLVAAVARQWGQWAPRAVATLYIEVVRNTPVLVQIFLVYFGLPAFGLRLSAFTAGVLALAVNGGAYLAEIIRAGFRAVPRGQLEAARVLDLSRRQVLVDVVLPQSLRLVYPPVVNELVQMILATSLLSTIALSELTGATLIANSITFQTMQVFTVALVLYLVLTNLVSWGARWLGRVAFHPPLDLRAARRPERLRRFAFLGRSS